EVFADDESLRATALVGQQRQQDVSRVLHVGAVRGRNSLGDPEKPEQAHDVVETDARGMTGGAADRVDERRPLRLPQGPRVEGGQAPVLPVAEEFVRWRADAHPRREVVLPTPRVESVRGKADRDVGDQSDLASGACQLAVDVKLQPGLKRDSDSEALAGGSDARCGRMADLL